MSRPSVCVCGCGEVRRDVARWPFALVVVLVAAALLVGCAPKRPPCEDRVVIVTETQFGVAAVLDAACLPPMRVDWSEWQDGAVVASCVCPETQPVPKPRRSALPAVSLGFSLLSLGLALWSRAMAGVAS